MAMEVLQKPNPTEQDSVKRKNMQDIHKNANTANFTHTQQEVVMVERE